MTCILGSSTYNHHGMANSIGKGDIVAVVHEERFSRKIARRARCQTITAVIHSPDSEYCIPGWVTPSRVISGQYIISCAKLTAYSEKDACTK